MRIFQNSRAYPSYLSRQGQDSRGDGTFNGQVTRFLDHRHLGAHILEPVQKREATAFFTIDNDDLMQQAWAREAGMSTKASSTDILLAQIESHRTEVFYNTNPVYYGSDFVRRLPGCVYKTVAWCNIPTPTADFSRYNLVLSNSAKMLRLYEERGWRAAYFSPAHDPVMDEYAGNEDRPIDVLFVGGYSRHHMRRAAILEAVARLSDRFQINFCLDSSRFTRLAESPLGYLVPLGKYRRPRDIRSVSREPVYGRDMYELISRSKIVLNGTIDVSGEDRGNLRCFESMGCRSLLLSDAGVYPDGMEGGNTLVTYESPIDAVNKIDELLKRPSNIAAIANKGYSMVKSHYTKARQWKSFADLLSDI